MIEIRHNYFQKISVPAILIDFSINCSTGNKYKIHNFCLLNGKIQITNINYKPNLFLKFYSKFVEEVEHDIREFSKRIKIWGSVELRLLF